MLGTEWVAPGDGSTIADLYYAFSTAEVSRQYGRASRVKKLANVRLKSEVRTNLRLTGAPIKEYDWQRLESDVLLAPAQATDSEPK